MASQLHKGLVKVFRFEGDFSFRRIVAVDIMGETLKEDTTFHYATIRIIQGDQKSLCT
jgi:hypothetical protein